VVNNDSTVRPNGNGSAAQPRLVRSVRHAVAVLRALGAAGRPLALSELARKVGLSKTSTLHLVRTLEVERFVARDEFGHYRLSWGVYELGSVVTRNVDLTRVARIHLDRLAEETNEAVLLAIAEGRSVLYLDRGQSNESFTMVANVGRRSPLHTNASGKLLLAHMPGELVDSVIADGLERRTPATIVDPGELKDALAVIRAQGYATCWQEQESSLNSIAAPLWDYTGQVCAALTVAGPSNRLTKRSVTRILAMIRREAEIISTALGGEHHMNGRGGPA
jgi:DNA-binding IclR family transcriptional regulator